MLLCKAFFSASFKEPLNEISSNQFDSIKGELAQLCKKNIIEQYFLAPRFIAEKKLIQLGHWILYVKCCSPKQGFVSLGHVEMKVELI